MAAEVEKASARGVQSTIPDFFNAQRSKSLTEKPTRKSDGRANDSKTLGEPPAGNGESGRVEIPLCEAVEDQQSQGSTVASEAEVSLKQFYPSRKRQRNVAEKQSKEIGDKIIFQGQAVVVDSLPAVKTEAGKEEEDLERDDIDTGAALLQALCARPEGGRAGGREEEEEAGGEREEGSAVMSLRGLEQKDWAWEASCHEGLLTFHDGRKRWYHCTECDYFNDRLYHSKMHFDRIHVKQGKSMPRKRKYMEPAGSAGHAAALPPSSLQQAEAKGSRTRQRGDKWLKTLSTDPATSGFRYESVLATGAGGEGEGEGSESSSSGEGTGWKGWGPAEGAELTAAEEAARAEAMQLDPAAARLWCWEGAESVGQGVQRGRFALPYRRLFVFTTSTPTSSPGPKPPPPAPAALPPAAPQPSAAPPLRWWWHRGAGQEPSPPPAEPPAPRPEQPAAPARGGGGSGAEGAGAQGGAEAGGVRPAAEEFAVAAAAAAGRAGMAGLAGRAAEGKARAKEAKSKGGAGGGKTKRGWKRWDAAEEAALSEAVRRLGTKDWGAIHQEMGTERSIKQLQDHWNDTKHDRKGSKPQQ